MVTLRFACAADQGGPVLGRLITDASMLRSPRPTRTGARWPHSATRDVCSRTIPPAAVGRTESPRPHPRPFGSPTTSSHPPSASRRSTSIARLVIGVSRPEASRRWPVKLVYRIATSLPSSPASVPRPRKGVINSRILRVFFAPLRLCARPFPDRPQSQPGKQNAAFASGVNAAPSGCHSCENASDEPKRSAFAPRVLPTAYDLRTTACRPSSPFVSIRAH
jgi:hypothetical protein